MLEDFRANVLDSLKTAGNWRLNETKLLISP